MSSSLKKHPLITGAFILMLTGLTSRVIGFFYRIFLSHAIGAEGMGIYQLVFPVYTLCFALVVSGMQTGISRCCAAALAEKDPSRARTCFLAGFGISFSLSLAAALFLHRHAAFLSLRLLGEPRCQPLLELISWGIPLGTVHTCVSAYYYARQKTAVPSAAQLLEQLVRVSASLLIWAVFLDQGRTPTPILAVGGMIAGELASSLFTGICLLVHFQDPVYRRSSLASLGMCSRSLLTLALPLTANRVLLTLLQSAEAILIPRQLQLSGMSDTAALTIYGVFTGMAMPFLMFPSAITGSVSTLLLPTVAGDQARGDRNAIRTATEKTIKYCLLLGIFFAGVFFFHGESLGILVFHNKEAGIFLKILSFICPFLYLTGTLSSILHGLGHTFLGFLQNLAGLLIRILFILLAVPRLGITGYLWGILVSQLVITGLNMYFIRRYVDFRFQAFSWILQPAFALFTDCGCSLLLQSCLTAAGVLPPLAVLILGLLLGAAVYLGLLFSMGLLHTETLKRLLSR